MIALLLLLLAVSGSDDATITLTNQPVYGGQAEYHVHLDHAYHGAKFSTFCYQFQEDRYFRVWQSERFLTNDREQDVADGPLMAPSPIGYLEQRSWDATLPANCGAVIFRDTNGKGPIPLSESISFTVTS